MATEIAQRLKDQLDFYKVDIDYDPEKGEYRTWYQVPMKVEFNDRGFPFSFCSGIRRKISIRTKLRDRPKYMREMAEDFVHEATEADLGVWRTPYFCMALAYLLLGRGEPLENAALVGGVYAIGETATKLISRVRLRNRPKY